VRGISLPTSLTGLRPLRADPVAAAQGPGFPNRRLHERSQAMSANQLRPALRGTMLYTERYLALTSPSA
jgi:hypothetical protein